MENMKIYQIDCKVYLLEDINYEEMQSQITLFVDEIILKNPVLRELHNTNCFKNYVFSGFKKISQDGKYTEGSLNVFAIRCMNRELAEYFQKELANGCTKKIKGLVCEKKSIEPGMIQKLYGITPAVMKFEDGYWRKNHTLDEFQKRIISNAIRKYNQYMNTEIEEPVLLFSNFKLLNKVPIKTRYKDINLLGDKFELIINENPNAQKLARLILAFGICELNARGYGFMNYQSM